MKKKDKIYDSPEYKQIREHLPEILKEMERDKGLKQYQMPEGWNEDFERIYQAEHRKERIRNCILAGACAAIILGIGAVHVGERLELNSMVQADDIGKTTENGFEDGEYEYSLQGNVNENEQDAMSEDTDEIYLESTTLTELNEEIRSITKCPMFVINNVSNGYTLTEATYSKLHRNFSYRINWDEQYVYISQQMQVDDVGNGTVNDIEKDSIYLEAIDSNVKIYESAQDQSLKCNIVHNNNTLFVVSNLDLKEYEQIISSIKYQ